MSNQFKVGDRVIYGNKIFEIISDDEYLVIKKYSLFSPKDLVALSRVLLTPTAFKKVYKEVSYCGQEIIKENNKVIPKSINEIAQEANRISESKGFWDSYNNINFLSIGYMYATPLSKETKEEYREAEIAKKLALIMSEVSEALEARRGGKKANREEFDNKIAYAKEFCSKEFQQKEFQEAFKDNIKDSFEDEMADAFIRLVELCAKLGIDLEWHVEQKMKYNATREKMHGKAY